MDSFRGDGLNLYAYVANNPVNYIDPTGHCKEKDSGTAGRQAIDRTFTGSMQHMLDGGGSSNSKEVTNVLNKYRIAGVGFLDYGFDTIFDGNIFEKVGKSVGAIKEIIDLGVSLYNDKVSFDELKQILGDKATDAFIGGLLYVKDNYYIMGKGVTTTESAVYQLGYQAGKAYNEILNIGVTAYGLGKTIKSGISKLRAKMAKVTRTINPNEIRYSQSSVNGADDIVQSMQNNGWNGDPIDVVKMPDGKLTTIDNTRVVAAREVGINVEAVVHQADDLLPVEFVERFTTKKGVPTTWGEAIELRVGKQKASFRNGNPYGSDEIERVGR